MTTGYTHSQIQELIDQAARNAPAHPTHSDLMTAPTLSRVAMAGTDVGALVRIALKGRSKPVTFFLNPYITLELMIGIFEAGTTFQWWDGDKRPKTKPMPELQPDDLEKAQHVTSIATVSEPKGILVKFAGREAFTFYLPRKCAPEIVATLKDIGDRATWWDQNYVLLPKPN
jgi:hypothetical protein